MLNAFNLPILCCIALAALRVAGTLIPVSAPKHASFALHIGFGNRDFAASKLQTWRIGDSEVVRRNGSSRTRNLTPEFVDLSAFSRQTDSPINFINVLGAVAP